MAEVTLPMVCGDVTLIALGKVCLEFASGGLASKRARIPACCGREESRHLFARPCNFFVRVRQLDPAALGSHDEDYVYPVGFRTSRKHASATNPSSKCLYHSEITTGPQGTPVFKVTCADMSEHPYEDSTPNVCLFSCGCKDFVRCDLGQSQWCSCRSAIVLWDSTAAAFVAFAGVRNSGSQRM